MDLIPTPSQTVGPFFHFSLTSGKHRVQRIAGPEDKGERVWLSCRVYDGAGQAVPDAMIETWQADADGVYPSVDNSGRGTASGFRGFGRMPTAEDGSCDFETIKPGPVPGPDGLPQAPHLEVALFARGLLKQLFTRIYFAGEAANASDPVLALVPADRRETLMARPDPARPGRWTFDVRMQGDQETVFFDV
jgi:protocatechuate 3,4-dioxygenase, alpha subunit